MKKTKKIKKYKEYRAVNINGIYSIVEVILNTKEEIIGYGDYVIPTADSKYGLTLILSSMLKASRKDCLTEEDLKSIKK